jgi:fructoselysine-6-P-deglycase FrlB-like protein
MPGEKTRAAVTAQPDWLARVPTGRRLPEGRIVYTGCGTSYHAAQTGGVALQALEAVLAPPDADLLVSSATRARRGWRSRPCGPSAARRGS